MSTLRLARVLVPAIVAGSLFVGGIARAADAPGPDPTPQPVAQVPQAVETHDVTPVAAIDSDATCGDVSASQDETSVSPDQPTADATSATEAVSCRPCKGRTWCKCTYNGMPRSSCNPCCYTNDIGVTTCLD